MYSIDVIVPEFNELSRQGRKRFDAQLDYFSDLARHFNVILIDDASTDGSWKRLMELAPGLNPRLHLVRMSHNGRKVLAVKHALGLSDAHFVLLTDFDSCVEEPERIPTIFRRFEEDPRLAGVSLRLVPEGRSLMSLLQDIEYAIGRAVFGEYMNSQKRVRCVPGAAGIWHRNVLLEVLAEHSGRHNGDDLEATAIALRKGYGTAYDHTVSVSTFVPQGPRELFTQRRRWELGALETYEKEREFYIGQIRNLRSRLGHVTLLDWYGWATVILSPLLVVNLFINPRAAEMYMLIELSLTSIVGLLSRNEVQDRKELALVPIFPIYRLLVTVPRIVAFCKFVRAMLSKSRSPLLAPPLSGFLSVETLGMQEAPALQRLVCKSS